MPASEVDTLRELLQYRIIAASFAKAAEDELVLKGGFAMRLGQGSRRMTKDIDMQQSTAFGLSRLQSLMGGAIRAALAQSGLTEAQITMPKQTDTTARWKINGKTAGGSNLHLTVEVSRRHNMPAARFIKSVPVFQQESGMQLVEARVFDKDAMAATKVLAILSDNRQVTRDLFDLDLLIRLQAEPPPEMIRHLSNPGIVDRIYGKLGLFTWDSFQTEVWPSLDERERSRWDISKFEEVKILVASTLEKWLAPMEMAETTPATTPVVLSECTAATGYVGPAPDEDLLQSEMSA